MENQNQSIPQEWICPISQQIMEDPVIADDGYSYQRKSIQDWFKTSDLSPLTGLVLPTKKLIPNRALKNTIIQFIQKFQKYENQNQKQGQKPNENKEQPKIKVNKIKQMFNRALQVTQEKINLNSYSFYNSKDESYILNLQIIPPEKLTVKKRKQISLVCILDTSESMNIDAVKDSKDNESHGFSRLDLVRHSINTLIEFMDDGDQLTLITFNTSAQCILHTTKMTKAGKKAALQKIKQLEGTGTTNIWQGLRISLQMLKKINHKNKNVFTILLTDGEPNLNPPRGIVPTLKKYIEIEELITPNIHVFGYGYQLDTKLLEQIARKGAGTFAYIPDCSMVGTVFINFMANCLTTITNRLQLSVQFPTGSKNIQFLGFSPSKNNTYNLGCIQYGQKRDLTIKVPKNYLRQGVIKFNLKYGQKFQQFNTLQISSNLESIKKQISQNIQIKFQYLELLHKCISYGTKFELALNDIHHFYYQLIKHDQNEFISILLKELKCDNDQNLGQVQKAFLKEQWYKKWGKTYIPSLLLAHLMQVCTNFKDPLLQLYGGQLFQKYQNQLDTIFIKMQPPKPSAKKQKNIVYKPAPVNMSYYYNNYGGCIDQQCNVTVWKLNHTTYQLQPSQQKLKNLKKGDLVGKNKVKILCMVETKVFAFVDMVKLGNLVITPWHPIIHNGKWVFPIDIKPQQKVFVQSYFNFITQNNQSLQIQQVQCISLGHSIQNNPITSHQYLSSPKVIQDLKQNLENYEKGLVTIRSTERNQVTGRISKFIVC